MEESSHNSSNFSLFLILIVCTLFVSLDAYELYKSCESWNVSIVLFDNMYFENCVKFQMLSKIIFTIFSFLAALSSVIITSCILISIDFFISKLLKTYVQMNILIFGPYLLGLSLLGFFHWQEIFYVCENVIINSQIKKNFSSTIFFNSVACFVISSILTVGFMVYNCFEIYANSITDRRDGNGILKKIFWCVVLRFRRRDEQRNVLTREQNVVTENLLSSDRL